MAKFITVAEAAEWVHDGDYIAIMGSGGGVLEPDAIYRAIEERFLSTGSPRDLSITAACGFGDKGNGGMSRFAYEGLTKRIVGGHWAWSPRMQRMANENKIEAYNLPQGALVSQFRELAAHRAGLITQIGLKTFVDPRVSGGKLNRVTTEDLVDLVNIGGKEWLHYKPQPLDIVIIRGSVADEDGNISIRYEPINGEHLCMAQAAHNNRGKVICQVKYLVKRGTLSPREVKVPGILVDAVVVVPDQCQTNKGEYNPTMNGELRIPLEKIAPIPLNQRKIIARRAAMELHRDDVINLGVGMPDGVAAVAAEEGVSDQFTMTLEQGIVGGVPAQGDIFGVAFNPTTIVDTPYQFDFYSGGGLDLACLGMAQADRHGNVNVSKFGSVIAGCGGFIDISQTAKKCVFCGTFTAGGLKTSVREGKLSILQEGRIKKFVDQVEHITFSGAYARETSQKVLYVTERAVFELEPEGLVLKEIAPGIDLKRDVLGQMAFSPIIPREPRLMDHRIFQEGPMGLNL